MERRPYLDRLVRQPRALEVGRRGCDADLGSRDYRLHQGVMVCHPYIRHARDGVFDHPTLRVHHRHGAEVAASGGFDHEAAASFGND